MIKAVMVDFPQESFIEAMAFVFEVRDTDLELIIWSQNKVTNSHNPADFVLCSWEWGALITQIFQLNKVLPNTPFTAF